MRIKKSRRELAEGDMTPMIDMTFQLIAFFMVLINFSQAEQDDKVKLPDSELARPPDAPLVDAITLHIRQSGVIVVGGDQHDMEQLRKRMILEKQYAEDPTKVTVIIRGDREVATGKVQEVIRLCQDVGFELFALRAKERILFN
ncbi:ExbD/TolR family protein [Blastopirellula retiformator]|uniref:Biopolymer transport protein ExbD n=1 Tax=Blastopirellula retiformator TaxID=2527970 RepID=A0A5C5UZF9_9BACT|nr:biopolymer transporter ExbD [Blastopirellula retiformator]TWT31756.1 biopolymer transport protein ExbD [Blastopirellula retiformator]